MSTRSTNKNRAATQIARRKIFKNPLRRNNHTHQASNESARPAAHVRNNGAGVIEIFQDLRGAMQTARGLTGSLLAAAGVCRPQQKAFARRRVSSRERHACSSSRASNESCVIYASGAAQPQSLSCEPRVSSSVMMPRQFLLPSF